MVAVTLNNCLYILLFLFFFYYLGPTGVSKAQEIIETFLVDLHKTQFPEKSPSGMCKENFLWQINKYFRKKDIAKTVLEPKETYYEWFLARISLFSLKVQSCKLYNDKYMIASAQITNTKNFAFMVLLVFKLLSHTVLFMNRKENRNC